MSKEERLKALMASLGLTKTGYAGLNRNGEKVDRRKFPDAVPFGRSTPLNIPNPRCIKCEAESDPSALYNSLCKKCRTKQSNSSQPLANSPAPNQIEP